LITDRDVSFLACSAWLAVSDVRQTVPVIGCEAGPRAVRVLCR
jgi:hypothetical protein